MILVDTNVLSELSKPRANPRVVAWAERQNGIAMSVISLEEIQFGIARVAGARRARLAAWLAALLEANVELLDITPPIARHGGELRARRVASGFNLHQADALIAATGVIHGLSVATRNTRNFVGCGVDLLDPFA